MSPELRDAIVSYTAAGWYVFPLYHTDEGKMQPLVKWGEAATKNTGEAIVLFGRYKDIPNLGIGIATGPSGLCVVDIDHRNGGSIKLANELFEDILGHDGFVNPL